MIKNNNLFEFQATGITILIMFFYGFIALVFERIYFDYRIALLVILFIFLLDLVTDLIKKYLCN